MKKVKKGYVQRGPFSKQWRSLKHLPLEKQESAFAAWFKQARESNASIDRRRRHDTLLLVWE
jgi:hypothetical protein